MLPGLPKYLNYGSPVNRGNPLNRRKLGWWMSLPNAQSTSRIVDMAGKNHFTMRGSAGISHGGLRPGGFAASYDLSTSGAMGSAAITPPTTAFTMGCWFKTTVVSASNATILGWNNASDGTSGTFDRTLYVEGSGKKLNWYVGGTYASTTPVANDGLWHFAVGTIADDASTGRCYMDGVKYQGGAGFGAFNSYSSPYLCVGLGASSHVSIQGCVDDWFYHDRCLTDSEIYALYMASKAKYQSQLNWYSHAAMTEAVAAAVSDVYFRQAGRIPMAILVR